MPALDGATEWFGATQAQAEAVVQGKPTLVHFWAISCGICKENMPRYESDTDVEQVRDMIATHQITEHCAVDNEHKLRDAFQNEQGYVPAYYLFDGEGKLRGFAAGERGLDLLKATLDRVLAQRAEAAAS